MGIELVIFIGSILFGIFLYWRESNGNGLYRFINKVMNSKALQMAADNPKGFIYKQTLIPRIIFVGVLFLMTALVLEFLTPISIFASYNGISALSSAAVGTLVGTYLANFVIKSTEVIEEKSDSIGDIVGDAVEKGKEFIEDLKTKGSKGDSETLNETDTSQNEIEIEPEVEKKSARERLKDKGLM
ncbi:hypothetical protein [Winogradskyella immobilis]|uniref:Uncharacterized protein n=1 Tax=Winogradskyella immobilis TaxID=2816852 RepID=A0ABS8EM52_9FLAO|nr:hypothetical protein [Winogradskyella immobilis]MCC1484170.1 hypothetical protein [Winogradskyella immobilis]MCG0016262.1 hypothetical protein [Winogradskyella immobilis]